jgi:hypothetical protein
MTSNAWAATDYYVSSSGGNDAWPGSQAQPWKSIDHVSDLSFQAGDRILLKRGDIFTGRLVFASSGTREAPIVIGAYGDPNDLKPLLTASGMELEWTWVSPGCFKAIDPVVVSYGKAASYQGPEMETAVLLANDANGNEHDLDTPEGVEAYLEELLAKPGGAWGPRNGADSDKIFVCRNGLGSTLSSAEMRVFGFAMDLRSDWVIIEDLEVAEAFYAVVARSTASHLTLRRVDVQNTIDYAVYLTGFDPDEPADIAVLDSTFDQIRMSTIYLQGTSGALISGNTISNVGGSVLGIAAPADDLDTQAVSLEGAKNVAIEHNTFLNTLKIMDDAPFVHGGTQDDPDYVSIHHNYMANVETLATVFSKNAEVHHNVWVGREEPSTKTKNGISVVPKSGGRVAIFNNVFYGVGDSWGIRVDAVPVDHVTSIFNNVVYAGEDRKSNFRLIEYHSNGKIISDHNVFYGMGTSPSFRLDGQDTALASLVAAGFEAHSTYADPLFVSATPLAVEDFQADVDSPLLEAGIDPKWLRVVEASAPFVSFDGLWGKEGLAPDIGAYDADVDGTTLEDGLILSAHFDERTIADSNPTLVDASGLNFHGTPYSGAASVASGKIRGAVGFDGVDDRAEFGTLGGWNPATFTISFWMKSTGVGTSLNPRIASRKLLLDYYTASDKISIEMRAATQNSLATSTTLTENVWHHVVCTYDDAGDRQARIYVDGSLNVTGNASVGGLLSQSSQILLLAKHSTQDNYFKGLLDELNIWNRVLDATEIAQLYNGGNGTAVQASPALPILDKSTPNFLLVDLANYGTVTGATAEVPAESKGATLRLTNSGWKRLLRTYTVTTNTRLAFDFRSAAQGDIHAIGLDTNDTPDPTHTHQIYGTAVYGNTSFKDYHMYNGGYRHYDIPIGLSYTGVVTRMFFANEGALAESEFSNVHLYEAP